MTPWTRLSAANRSDRDALYVQPNEQKFWTAQPGESPRLLDAGEFWPCAEAAERLRCMGSQENAGFILELLERGCAVSLVSPRICRQCRSGPEQLFCLQRCELPASLGGWHAATFADLIAYWLCVHTETAGDRSEVADHATLHPVERFTRFAGIDPELLGGLIGLIRDPRWFINPQQPDRSGPLRLFLGVQPKVADRPGHARFGRYDAVLQAWRRSPRPAAPRDFLWRIAEKHGVLAATAQFVNFLRLVWLQALYPSQELFLPEEFFMPDELASYRAYIG